MDDSPDPRLQDLRERVSRSEYAVDAPAVAAAILARLLGLRASSETPG